MVATCLHLAGFVCSFIGWIGVVVATATNDWVVTCGYTITTCRKMDELGSKGLWADCVMATGLYHCKPLVDILILPGINKSQNKMLLLVTYLIPTAFHVREMYPVRMGHEPGAAKYRRSQLGGILIILLAMCGVVATIWFPVCAHRETTIMSFGYSLYTGWIGSALCLFGGCVIVCCSGDAQTFGENRFYYASGSSSPTHAKSAHV
ncbi:Claudin-11 [Dryobates pubescens]|uniref:Claudin n=1 Tax=Dryobates pubescens TaxID=118200 RepID=A0A093GP53_DRYPU|nr:Claudin-11 [Dryobates pubescens]